MTRGCRACRRRTRDGTRTRAGSGWTLRTVASILANPRYTGRQVWNRQPSEAVLVDPADTGLGHRQVQRWNLPEGWVISKHPAHAALVSEADFIAAQDTTARGPAGPAVRRYLLAELITCRRWGRRLESAWSYGRAAYRCLYWSRTRLLALSWAFHAACRYSLISPLSRVRRWILEAGTERAVMSWSSSGARSSMPSPW